MKLTMNLGRRSHDIIVKKGVLDKASLLCNLGGKVMLVTDDGVPAAYVKKLAAQCGQAEVLALPQGEAGKSAQQCQAVQSRMLEKGFSRQDTVAALGGGMVADVAGFAAATYLGGAPLCQFPTTTMAQADGSIGGRRCLNLEGEKDVLSVTHHPAIVVADPALLKTLPPRHFAAGLAEAVKVALVAGSHLFEILEAGDVTDDIERVVCLSLLYKKSLVEQDEDGRGQAGLLRFGQPLAGALEAGGGFAKLLHGEALALGMLPMIESRLLARRTRALLKKLGLPQRKPAGANADQLLPHLAADAGREGDVYLLARVKKLGHGYLERVPAEELEMLVRGE